MRRLLFFVLFLLIGLFAMARAAGELAVTVKKHPAKINRHTFDPKRPPAALPKLAPTESGVCQFEFTCNAGMSVFVEQTGPNAVEVEVDSVDVILDLPIDLWVMTNAPKQLVAHEEGHRQICEDYYRDADEIARGLAKKMIGRKASATGRSKQEAQEKAQTKLLTEFNTAYMTAVRVRCRAAQDIYDEITGHGLQPIAEADAIAQAKARESRR